MLESPVLAEEQFINRNRQIGRETTNRQKSGINKGYTNETLQNFELAQKV